MIQSSALAPKTNNIGLYNGLLMLLRRMRLPLIVLIVSYSVSVLGLVLIPGQDAEGQPWRMSFLHAFYFISFLGSTIGLGEIPYPFTDAQRLWTTFAIYISVFSWVYTIGVLVASIQDPAFRRAITRSGFTRKVRRLAEPFYLVCGYGDTGSLLVKELAEQRIQAVVVDNNQDRIDALELEDLGVHVPALCADASDSSVLFAAGLTHPRCQGVIALTRDDNANLKIAIAAKLLNPKSKVICRAETHETEANMASFGTDHIINAFDSFADRFAMAIHSPSRHAIYEWLTSVESAPLAEPLRPPRGQWVLCGYGRFGKAVSRFLSFEGIDATIIEADPEKTRPPKGTVIGVGTEAVTLREAKTQEAAGIIAGTDNDVNNLSIIITARELNPRLFIVVRQNQRKNDALFDAAQAHLVMQPSALIARRILALIRTPLLAHFLHDARHQDDEWANVLISRIIAVTEGVTPEVWTLELNDEDALAVCEALEEGRSVRLEELRRDASDRTRRLPCVPLFLQRGQETFLMPDEAMELRRGDKILFCGSAHAPGQVAWIARNYNVLDYVQTGKERPSSYVWRWLARARSEKSLSNG